MGKLTEDEYGIYEEVRKPLAIYGRLYGVDVSFPNTLNRSPLTSAPMELRVCCDIPMDCGEMAGQPVVVVDKWYFDKMREELARLKKKGESK